MRERAKEILRNCNARMTINYAGCDCNADWGDNTLRDYYSVTISKGRKRMHLTFWNSVYDTETHTAPEEYDILACLQKYDVGTLDDFVSEFGYEIHSLEDYRKVERTYKAVRKEYADLCRLFDEPEMEMLREVC